MAQISIIPRGRAGWTHDEKQTLWDEVRKVGENGGSLRTVFENVAAKTGRKPDSVRNYYYLSVKEGDAPQSAVCQRALPFIPFDDDELHSLVRDVLTARTQGMSVRRCVMALGDGDKSKTLRYQNKYRSILKNKPEYIQHVMRELESEGVEFSAEFSPVRKQKHKTAKTAPADADDCLLQLREAIAECAGAEKLIGALCDFLKTQTTQ